MSQLDYILKATNKMFISSFFFFLKILFQQQPAQFINPETPGYVGFANLPNQVHRKSVKKGFEFTLMVVGKKLTSALQLIKYALSPLPAWDVMIA